MESNEMTILEALKVTKQILDGICVPVAQLDSIGGPLKAAADNLGTIIEGIEQAEREDEHGKTEEL